ncbi:MAG TPA: MBL fold metallo-hydrolase [Blastocatellia bacterium]|nr:MBL fold metallo-hydrolase [Blastocatellia bacterium]
MNRKLLAFAQLTLISLLTTISAAGWQSEGATEKSYQQARRVLDAGIRALGGLEAISAIRNFTIAETGKQIAVEFPNPEPEYDMPPWEETTVIDFSGSRLLSRIKAWNQGTIISGSQGFWLDLRWKRAAALKSASLQNYPDLMEKLPHFLLRDAVTERAASLRWLGEGEFQGRKQQVISFVNRRGQQVSLCFDARTHLLTKYEFLYTDGVTGDTLQEHIYSGYRSAGGFQVPEGATRRLNGRVAQETRYERVEINGQLADSLFALPEGFEMVSPSSYQPPQPLTMTKIAEDVYLLQRVAYDNNVLVVAFNDYILVVESPELGASNTANERAIARIRETIPGKPIRYHAFTHFHADHSGGARAYIAEGATIVTTPGNKTFVERMAAAPFTMMPDALARRPRQPVIELIKDKKHVLRDDRHVVEFHDVGPYPHVKEEIIVYLPQHKLLFEGDLFTSTFREDVVPASDGAVLLADKIRQLRLDVEKIVGVHGRLRPIEDLHKAIEMRNRLTVKQPQQTGRESRQ